MGLLNMKGVPARNSNMTNATTTQNQTFSPNVLPGQVQTARTGSNSGRGPSLKPPIKVGKRKMRKQGRV